MKPPKQDYSMSLHKVDEDEKLLAIVRRHPFGIIKLYVQVIVGLLGAGALIFLVLPGAFPAEDYGSLYTVISIIGVLVGIFMLFVVIVATIIYNMSQLVITDQTITQTIQTSLFSRKTSQLAVSSVEDVTANKSGLFPTIFNYGRLVIETAGEQENFHFDYCPHADHYAKLVLETRQQFMGGRESDSHGRVHSYAQTTGTNNVSNSSGSGTAISGVPAATSHASAAALNLGAVAADGAAEDQNQN